MGQSTVSAPHRARRRVGVVAANGVVVECTAAEPLGCGAMAFHPTSAFDLGGLLAWAQDNDYEQLWLHRSYLNGPGCLVSSPPAVGPPSAPGWSVKGDHWLHCYRSGERFDPRPVDVVIPRDDSRSSFWDELAVDELARALRLFSDAMGVRYRRSPEATGSRLLTMLHDGGHHQGLAVTEMPPPALDAKTEADPYWIRDPLPEESGARWVVAYDANAAYLAAASSLRTGMGKVRYVAGDALGAALDACAPGYYYGAVTYTPPPGVLNPFRDGWGFLTTPILELAQKLKCERVEISEGYVWETTARPLESWYKVIREGRGYLMDRTTDVAARYALKAVKLLYGPFLGGRVASTKWERGGDPLFRPDWRHFVMATTRANQYRTLLRCASFGHTPFAIASDCLFFLSSEPLDEPAGLRVGTNPGAYKWVNAAPVSDPDTAAALDPALSARRRLKKLQSAMRSQA